MENRSIKDRRKAKLPPLLSGSEYKTDDSDVHLVMNLLGLAVTIVVYAKKDGISDDCKEAWFKSFEEEYKKAQLYHKKTINFNAQHSSNITPISDDTDCASPIYKMILNWLRKSLLDSPNWDRLYALINIQTTWLSKDPSADWWNKVQSVCRKAETTIDLFDPIAEIWRITEKHHAEDRSFAKSERAQATIDEPQEEDGQGEKNKKGILRKLWWIIATVVGFLAALLTCLYYLGWLEPIKVFIYKLFAHK